jgi:hypothetical protein
MCLHLFCFIDLQLNICKIDIDCYKILQANYLQPISRKVEMGLINPIENKQIHGYY